MPVGNLLYKRSCWSMRLESFIYFPWLDSTRLVLSWTRYYLSFWYLKSLTMSQVRMLVCVCLHCYSLTDEQSHQTPDDCTLHDRSLAFQFQLWFWHLLPFPFVLNNSFVLFWTTLFPPFFFFRQKKYARLRCENTMASYSTMCVWLLLMMVSYYFTRIYRDFTLSL